MKTNDTEGEFERKLALTRPGRSLEDQGVGRQESFEERLSQTRPGHSIDFAFNNINSNLDRLNFERNEKFLPETDHIGEILGSVEKAEETAAAAAAMDYSLFVFGFSASGAVVTVSKGYCQHSTRGTITSPETDVTITADHQFIVVNYVFGSGAVTLSTSGAYPLPDGTVWRKPLHQCRLIGGVASLEQFCLENMSIPGTYA